MTPVTREEEEEKKGASYISLLSTRRIARDEMNTGQTTSATHIPRQQGGPSTFSSNHFSLLAAVAHSIIYIELEYMLGRAVYNFYFLKEIL